jgi:hypothetical protein
MSKVWAVDPEKSDNLLTNNPTHIRELTRMLSGRLRHIGDTSFKCEFCGFVYKEIKEAEECELHCVTHALALAERKENAINAGELQAIPTRN